MSKYMSRLAIVVLCAWIMAAPAEAVVRQPVRPLVVGVTLQAYYSWVATLTQGTPVEVVAVFGAQKEARGGTSTGVGRLDGIDLLVVNGLGLDEFKPMLDAGGNRVAVIQPSVAVAWIAQARETHRHGAGPFHTRAARFNAHTYIALEGAVQQIQAIERALVALDPLHAAVFHGNAAAFVRRLRQMKSETLAELAQAGHKRVVVDDRYAYLVGELGLSSGTEGDAARVDTLDDLSSCAVTKDTFERAMRSNLKALVRAAYGDK